MSYDLPLHRRDAVIQAAEALKGARRVILTTHLHADGDGAGCEAALLAWLLARGAEAWIVNPTPFPDTYTFLLADGACLLDPGSAQAREVAGKADLAVVLDTGEFPRIGRVAVLLEGKHTLVVDHHPSGDHPIPGLSVRDPAACATGELLFDILRSLEGDWPPQVGAGLYTAILTDTGSFRFANATPASHRIAAELLERGVKGAELARRLYGSQPLRRLRLLHASLAELEVDAEGLVAWMTVPTSAYQTLGATPEDLEGLANYPREVEGVEVGLLFRETARGQTKVSFRSNGRVDVRALARRFGGGGHEAASGAVVEGPLERVRAEVVAAAVAAAREVRGGGEGRGRDGPGGEGGTVV